MSLQEFTDYLASRGEDINTLTKEEKRAWSETFDKSRQAGTAGVTTDKTIKKHEILNTTQEEIQTDDGNIIQLLKLPDNVEWPSMDSHILFVRDFYPSFYDEYVGNYLRNNRIIVCGTPGIGKSAFGTYCLYRGLKDNKTVIYQNSNKSVNLWYIYNGDTLSIQSAMPVLIMDDAYNSLYIADSVRPVVCACPTVLVTSPRKDIWGEFKKSPARMKWFGVWDRSNELDLLRKHCFPNITSEAMQDQTSLWGMIPRIAFTDPKSYTKENLMKLVESSDPESLIKSHKIDEDGKDNTTHTLVHITTDENFDQVGRFFASRQVGDIIYKLYKVAKGDRIGQFLVDILDPNGSKIFTLTQGHVFECMARDAIEIGGNFKFREIFPSSGQSELMEIDFKPLALTTFKSIEDVEVDVNKLFRPTNSKFTALDMLKLSPTTVDCFNATINVNHNVILDSAQANSGIYRYWDALMKLNKVTADTSLNFYFLLPDILLGKEFNFPKLLWNAMTDKKQESKKTRPNYNDKANFEKKVKFHAMYITVKRLHTFQRVVNKIKFK